MRKKKQAAPQPELRRINAFDFAFETLEGAPMPLAQWAGRPLLIVNTASRCGFTPQYEALQNLWERYRDRGLVVIGVPSNDFGNQEPWGAEKIRGFCTKKFGVDFPLTAKVKVTGFHAHPFYRWANRWAGFIGRPHWNFHKYLVAPEGALYDWFLPTTTPDAERITQAVELLLQN